MVETTAARHAGRSIERRDGGRLDWRNLAVRKKRPPKVDGRQARYRERRIPCGKNCAGCPHGPYVYLVWRDASGKLRERYLGKGKGFK